MTGAIVVAAIALGVSFCNYLYWLSLSKKVADHERTITDLSQAVEDMLVKAEQEAVRQFQARVKPGMPSVWDR